MTDEVDLAIDWIRSQGWNEENLPSDELLQMEQAFLAGLKAGEPQWHDLRKAPNDLPKKTGEYLTNIGVLTWDYYADGKGWHTELCEFCDCYDDIDSDEVIAWCEIPKFEENE